MVKVSVIIPVYNVEPYLRQCLDSIVGQTLKELEIICVDDSSTDGSLAILEEYAKKDSRIQVITQKNAGAGAARNRGMEKAKGKYLSFLDSDDFFEADMLKSAYELAEQDHSDFVVYKSDQYHTEKGIFVPVGWVVREDELPPYQPFNYRQMTDNIFKVFVGWAWDKLYLRSFVEQHYLKFQGQRTSNDMLFVFSSVVLADRISFLPKVYAHQRREAKDSLSKTRENSWWCFYDALVALRKRLKKEGLFQELEKDFINYALHFTLWNYNTLSEPTKTMLADKLTSEWLKDLGIEGKTEDYFYNKKEYEQYQMIFKGKQPEAVSESSTNEASGKVMDVKAKIKSLLRHFIPVGHAYLDKALGKLQKSEREMLEVQRRMLEAQRKMLETQRKALTELQKNSREQIRAIEGMKLYVDQEFRRRDDWGKMSAEVAREAKGRPVWVIKCPAPEDETKVRWGDYPFSLSLKRCLEDLGCYVLVDTREDWGCEEGADVVLALRGARFYRPDRRNAKCLYIMWNISHPDMVTTEEYQLYDVICVGSRHYAKKLQKELTIPVVPLLQCTDTSIFYPPKEEPERFERDYIFIGNSRGVARKCVMWSVEDQLPITMWGGGWNRILRDHMELIEAPFIENCEIPKLYRTSKVTLNDHWEDMLQKQFVNNRIFDALACGLPVISDTCEELREIFPDAVLHYENREEFEACLKQIETDYESVRAKVREQWPLIQKEYSFEARAKQLVDIAGKYGLQLKTESEKE